eukprot:2375852-Rhodomonas_salina.1
MKGLKERGIKLVVVPVHWRGRKWLPTICIVESNHATIMQPQHDVGDEDNIASIVSSAFPEAKIDTRRTPEGVQTVNMAVLTVELITQWLENPLQPKRSPEWMQQLHDETPAARAGIIRDIRKRWHFDRQKKETQEPKQPPARRATVVSWNMGGKGLKRAGLELREMGDEHSVILIQELRASSNAKKGLHLWLQSTMPNYDVYLS